MKQEKEINQLKETTRLEKEEHEKQWERKQKERQEQLKQKARLKYAEIVKERRMKREKEIGQLKETMRLENEEHETVEEETKRGTRTTKGESKVEVRGDNETTTNKTGKRDRPIERNDEIEE